MGPLLQIRISRKYKCGLPQNNEDIETDDDNETNRRMVNQLPAREKVNAEK